MVVYIEDRYRRIIFAASAAVSVLVLGAIILGTGFVPGPPYWIPIDMKINTAFASVVLLFLLAPTIVEFNNAKYLRGVERNLPRLLRDITDEVASGIPLMFALENATSNNYGPITDPLRQTVIRINTTANIEESFTWLAGKLIHPQARQFSVVMQEAYNTGGRITDILESSFELFTTLDRFREERNSLTGPYMMIVYLGTLVFLATSRVLLVNFIKPLTDIAGDDVMSGSGLVSEVLTYGYYKSILFWAAVAESVSGGVLGGKIRYGRIYSGLQYAAILLLITILFFNLMA